VSSVKVTGKEGSLNAPLRHPIDWRNPSFTDSAAVHAELERVFDICHGCRRCFSLCQSFPTLFDLVDATTTGELAEVAKSEYGAVVDHCYLCDLCFMTKCPYVPPHEWAVDFPHLMLRAKALKLKEQGATWRERVLASPKTVGRIAGVPVVAEVVNAVNRSKLGRKLLESTLGVAADAPIPQYHSDSARKQLARRQRPKITPQATPRTSGRVVLFTTCYGEHNMPELATDLCALFEHNGITVDLAAREQCCGMPRLELGDLQTVADYKAINVPELKGLIDQGFDIVAPIPSCVLMFKQELPLMFPEDADVQAVAKRIFDPFEYLWLRHEAGLLQTEFKQSLGKISYHAPCHLRVQNIGYKTRDILKLVPDTQLDLIERCSGHDGTYGVKKEFRAASMKIAKPVIDRVIKAEAATYSSDCPMAGAQITSGLPAGAKPAEHPLRLLRRAYGI
jgi:glycerol-3-phosphate dehydrogenase subunit C